MAWSHLEPKTEGHLECHLECHLDSKNFYFWASWTVWYLGPIQFIEIIGGFNGFNRCSSCVQDSGKSDRCSDIGVSLAIGHHHHPVTTDQRPGPGHRTLLDTRHWRQAPTCHCPAELQSAVHTPLSCRPSCSALRHQQQPSEEDVNYDAWKEIVWKKSKVNVQHTSVLIDTEATQFQAWQFWLWWNISWEWGELSSRWDGLAFPHSTIPHW